jgi:hypothetical protein
VVVAGSLFARLDVDGDVCAGHRSGVHHLDHHAGGWAVPP